MADIISSSNFHNLQRHNVDDKKDMVSNLPDDILHYILSLLPTKDAIGTSVLAKRWKYLWTYLSVLKFKNNRSVTYKKDSCLNQVDRLFHLPNYVKNLRIDLDGFGPVDADKVTSIISVAVKHKVENLSLHLNLYPSFVLPHSFSASESLNRLCLEQMCVLNIPSGICFPSLKTLKLACVTFADEKSVQQLFSGCLVLQKLTLFNFGWKNIRQTCIKFSPLRILKIEYDPLSSEELLNCTVKIDAANLISFSGTSYLTVNFILVNVTSLDYANIYVINHFPSLYQYAACRAIKLLHGIRSVKSLTLSNETRKCLSDWKNVLHPLPWFHNLTYVDVHLITEMFTSEALMDILQKTPKLEVLDIPMGFDPNFCLYDGDWILNSVPCCFKSRLKLFTIWHFGGDAAEVQLLKFSLKNATLSRKIEIICSRSLYVDLKKQDEIGNQLQCMGWANCVIEFR